VEKLTINPLSKLPGEGRGKILFLSLKRREAYSPTLALKGLGVRSVFHAI
jgi:hypothetical protein